jgi:hypothetical protein
VEASLATISLNREKRKTASMRKDRKEDLRFRSIETGASKAAEENRDGQRKQSELYALFVRQGIMIALELFMLRGFVIYRL